MLIELDILSGRPNPTWRLADAQARELLRRHEVLRPTIAEPRQPPGLGYRGFLYVAAGRQWRAFLGLVISDAETLADPDNVIERFLTVTIPVEHHELALRVARELERHG